MSKETVFNHWKSKETNYALRAAMTEAEFVCRSYGWFASASVFWYECMHEIKSMTFLKVFSI
jgi:hypothetical protein